MRNILVALLACALIALYGCGGTEQTPKESSANPTVKQVATPSPVVEEVKYKDKTVSQWIEALKDKSPETKMEAVRALSAIGPEAKAATGQLIIFARSSSEKVNDEILDALKKIDPNIETNDDFVALVQEKSARRLLKEIYRGATAYALSNSGANPPSLSFLVKEQLITEKKLATCTSIDTESEPINGYIFKLMRDGDKPDPPRQDDMDVTKSLVTCRPEKPSQNRNKFVLKNSGKFEISDSDPEKNTKKSE